MLLECVLTADTAKLRRESTGEAHEAHGFVLVTSLCEPCPCRRNGQCIRERSNLRSATRTGANTGQCLRTLRAWRPPEPLETMYACRVFVLNNMHISLDFNGVDFQGMLEVLGLLLIFMHRGI